MSNEANSNLDSESLEVLRKPAHGLYYTLSMV